MQLLASHCLAVRPNRVITTQLPNRFLMKFCAVRCYSNSPTPLPPSHPVLLPLDNSSWYFILEEKFFCAWVGNPQSDHVGIPVSDVICVVSKCHVLVNAQVFLRRAYMSSLFYFEVNE